MKRAAFWAVSGGLLVGLLCGVAMDVSLVEMVGLGVIGGALVATLSLLNEREWALLMSIAIIASLIGVWRAEHISTVSNDILDVFIGEVIEIQGSIRDEVEERDGYARAVIIVHTVVGQSATTTASGVILATLPPHTTARVGDEVKVRGTLARPQPFTTDTERVFDYDAYLAVRDIGYVMSFATLDVIHEGPWSVRRTLSDVKRWYIEGLEGNLVEPYASLAAGITVGARQGMSRTLMDTFRDAGLVHIVVLSGYNIMIIVYALFVLLARTTMRMRVVVSLVATTLFVLLTGASASVVRAALMVSAALVAKWYGRHHVATRVLVIAITAMVFYNPRILLDDPGFQLSVMATAGLLYVQPLIVRFFVWVRAGVLREVVTSTIATQLTVSPLLVYHMGSISLVGILANIIVLPVIPFAMLFAFVAGVYASFVGIGEVLVGFPAHLLLAWTIGVAEVVAALPGASLALPPLHGGLIVAVMIGVGVAVAYLWQRRESYAL